MRRRPIGEVARRAGRGLRQPPRDVLTTVHAALVLAVVEALIRWVRLPRLSRLLGVRVELRPVTTTPSVLRIEELPPAAERQLRCTWKVADAWPFSHGPCLRRALVGGHLVRRLDPAVRLGVASSADDLVAHAWLEIGGRPLEAVDGFARFSAGRGHGG